MNRVKLVFEFYTIRPRGESISVADPSFFLAKIDFYEQRKGRERRPADRGPRGAGRVRRRDPGSDGERRGRPRRRRPRAGGRRRRRARRYRRPDPASEEAVADDPTDPDNSDEVWDDGIVVDDGPGPDDAGAGREEATGATSEGVTEANEGATSTSSAAQSRSKAPILTKIPTRTTCLADSRSIRLPSLRSPTDSSTKSSDRSTPAT